MIPVRSGTQYEASLVGAPAGLIGTLGTTLRTPEGEEVQPRSVLGISQVEGVYLATRTAPIVNEDSVYWLFWDDPQIPTVYDEIFVDTSMVEPDNEGPDPLLPDIKRVGGLLRARTKNPGGVELGTFTNETRPTAAEVAQLVVQANNELSLRVGANIPVSMRGKYRAMAAYFAAMLVEISYFPEQVATGRSPYAQYERLYTSALQAFIAAVEAEIEIEGGGELPGSTGGMPSFSFPADGGGLVGWSTPL